jgi:putative N6-adenine-specific DNA methylase
LKEFIVTEKLAFFATCPRGLEKFLFEEVKSLKGEKIKVMDGGVSFSGDHDLMCRFNMMSRFATRLLRRVSYGQYKNEQDLYQAALKVNWIDLFDVNLTIKVSTTAKQSPLKSIDFVTLRIKDAVCDRFNDKFHQRPNVDIRDPDIKIHLFVDRFNFVLYLDSSGKPLYQRGYRIKSIEAPLKENLAAGIVAMSGWDRDQPLVDPMCGSGTILIEAALQALDIYPGVFRKFGFMKWHDFNEERFQKIRTEIKDLRNKKTIKLYGCDTDFRAVNAAVSNVESLKLSKQIEIEQKNFESLSDLEPHGILITNPPYGVRLNEMEDLKEDYQRWGSTLKQNFHGWKAYIISNDMNLPKGMRLNPSKKTPLFNGALDCRLFEFVMVKGSNRKNQVNEASAES